VLVLTLFRMRQSSPAQFVVLFCLKGPAKKIEFDFEMGHDFIVFRAAF
jgi:hypothetical protein